MLCVLVRMISREHGIKSVALLHVCYRVSNALVPKAEAREAEAAKLAERQKNLIKVIVMSASWRLLSGPMIKLTACRFVFRLIITSDLTWMWIGVKP